jgi:hypothetical protein
MEPDTQPGTRRPGEPEAIFVVGVSRSGTTLMRNVLNGHSRIGIAAENHYLGHLLPGGGYRDAFRREGPLADDATIRRIVARVYSKAFQGGSRLRPVSPFWRWVKRSVPPDELERRLLAAPRTEAGQFDALLRAYADTRGKAIPGEKTPAHVAFVDELLTWYPGAKVVHMIRDPRGVFVSELRRRFETPTAVPYRWLVRVPALFRAFVLLETAWAWAGAVRHHRRLLARHASAYRLVRFEDLVRDPEATVDALCAFLGVAPEPAMLEQEVTSRGTQLGQSGFDAGAADRWRETIGRGQAAWLGRLLGRRLAELGYEPWPPRERG